MTLKPQTSVLYLSLVTLCLLAACGLVGTGQSGQLAYRYVAADDLLSAFPSTTPIAVGMKADLSILHADESALTQGVSVVSSTNSELLQVVAQAISASNLVTAP